MYEVLSGCHSSGLAKTYAALDVICCICYIQALNLSGTYRGAAATAWSSAEGERRTEQDCLHGFKQRKGQLVLNMHVNLHA